MSPRQTPASWARAIRSKYELSETDEALVDLGRRAFLIARGKRARPADRLAATARFQAVVKQLNLESQTDDGEIETTTVRAFPSRAYAIGRGSNTRRPTPD